MDAPNEAEHGRLERVEARLDLVLVLLDHLRLDLERHLRTRERLCVEHAVRLRDLECETARTRVHLKWIKSVWAAVQAAVVGWLSWKR